MATSQVSLGFPSGLKIFTETALGSTVLAVVAAAATIYYIEIDNTANAGANSYLKMFNSNGAITLGTTAPDHVEMAYQGVKMPVIYPQGKLFSVGLQVACVTTGGTAGTTAPTSSVPVRIVYSS